MAQEQDTAFTDKEIQETINVNKKLNYIQETIEDKELDITKLLEGAARLNNEQKNYQKLIRKTVNLNALKGMAKDISDLKDREDALMKSVKDCLSEIRDLEQARIIVERRERKALLLDIGQLTHLTPKVD